MTSTLKAVSCAAALTALAAFSLPAAVQSAGSNLVNLGWFHFAPNDSSDPLHLVSPVPRMFAGSGVSVKDSDQVGLAFTHFFQDTRISSVWERCG